MGGNRRKKGPQRPSPPTLDKLFGRVEEYSFEHKSDNVSARADFSGSPDSIINCRSCDLI